MKRFLFGSVTLYALLLLGVAGGREVARRLSIGPSSASVLDADSCSQPCWHGIRAGITTLDQAMEMLQADTETFANLRDVRLGDLASRRREVCWRMLHDPDWWGCALRDQGFEGPINRIELEPPDSGLSLGDTILQFGNPVAAAFCTRLGFNYAFVYFPNNIEVRARGEAAVSAGAAPRYDPTMQVFLVRYHYPAAEPPYAFDTARWQGFTVPQGRPAC